MRLAGAVLASLVVLGPASGETIRAAEGRGPGGLVNSPGPPDARDSFSRPDDGLSLADVFRFKLGGAIFRKEWSSPRGAGAPSAGAYSGLGPLFNARSCEQCHRRDGRGASPHLAPDPAHVSLILKLSIPAATQSESSVAPTRRRLEWPARALPELTYGHQLQDRAIEGFTPEGQVAVAYTSRSIVMSDGEQVELRLPRYEIAASGYGPLAPSVMISPRIASPLIGLGLLEAIPEADIVARADPDDRDGDGISGRPNRALTHEAGRILLGRFGWKAGAPRIIDQTAIALRDDMGLSSRLAPPPFGDCTTTQIACRPPAHDLAAGPPEVSDDVLDLLVSYARNLAVPLRRDVADQDVLRGGRLFSEIGCAACHTPRHVTGVVAGSPHLSKRVIWPYTDLLLHEMGSGLADRRPEGLANGREWRTPPLWGIGLTETVTGSIGLLHDGRARSVIEAILWHDGEARRSRAAFEALGRADRQRLIRFVNSL